MDILREFVEKINRDSYIEDFNIVYAFEDDSRSASVCLQSNHNVYDYKGYDYFNDFNSYVRRVFSSPEWKEWVKQSQKNFDSNVDSMSEKINEEYHSEVIEENSFVFKDKLRSELNSFIDKNYEGSGFDSYDVDFNIILQSIDYFPVDYLKEKYLNDRKEQYHLQNDNIVKEYINKLLNTGFNDKLFKIRNIENGDHLISMNIYVNKPFANKIFKSDISRLFERSDFVRFVKHPIIFGNPEKIANNFNDIMEKKIYESENFDSLSREVKDRFTEYVDNLYRNNLNTEDQHNDFYQYDVKIDKMSSVIFDKEEISYIAEKERSKKKYKRRRK